MKREPLATTGTVTAAVTAVIALVVAFGVDLTTDQQTAILGVAAVIAPLVVALWTRRKVTPLADPRADSGTPLVPVQGVAAQYVYGGMTPLDPDAPGRHRAP
jgi:hypothetical protein